MCTVYLLNNAVLRFQDHSVTYGLDKQIKKWKLKYFKRNNYTFIIRLPVDWIALGERKREIISLSLIKNRYIHTYYSRVIPEGVAEAS
jgi:hypothetical protein